MNCPICLEQIKSHHSIWVCVTCKCVAHIKCFPDKSGAVDTKYGCPQCRTRLEEVIRTAKKAVKAPMGCFCYSCKVEIWEGENIIKCPSPDDVCVGCYHRSCYKGRCEACQKTPRQVILDIRNSKLAEVQEKLNQQAWK